MLRSPCAFKVWSTSVTWSITLIAILTAESVREIIGRVWGDIEKPCWAVLSRRSHYCYGLSEHACSKRNFFRPCENLWILGTHGFIRMAHTADGTVIILDKSCGNDWIGSEGKHAWPAGSPDQTVCDYCLWNELLKHINRCKTDTKNGMKKAVRAACSGSTAEECNSAISFFQRSKEKITFSLGTVNSTYTNIQHGAFYV
jgi:hypothetical protein